MRYNGDLPHDAAHCSLQPAQAFCPHGAPRGLFSAHRGSFSITAHCSYPDAFNLPASLHGAQPYARLSDNDKDGQSENTGFLSPALRDKGDRTWEARSAAGLPRAPLERNFLRRPLTWFQL